MSLQWLRRLFGTRPTLTAEQRLGLDAYRARPGVASDSAIRELRFVIADVETTGLNPYADQLISIGAVELVSGRIAIANSFEIVFRQSRASDNANILIHGIDGTTQLSGEEPAAATLSFLDYVRNSPLVGFHADFDRLMIDRAARAAVGIAPANPWIDLAWLAPALFPEGRRNPPRGLDDWMDLFGINNLARHNALADALATAQLLQISLARAAAEGITRFDELLKLERDQRWLRQR